MPDPTIEDLKALQARLDERDIHVCWIGPTGFVIAHTDWERANIPLEQCELHEWLTDLDVAPMPTGYYRAFPHDPDADGEPYGVPWAFLPIEVPDV